jgi:hypothetical protein
MEEIQGIIKSIVLQCQDDGVQVSETIAAFMARTVVQVQHTILSHLLG